jgi:hypothetical protein
VNVTSRNTQSGREGGFALIVALLALMLLTFLGLTLSATTSTELQISNNYRWSQQALYNAEAGLEVARVVLQRTGDGQLVLPETRSVTWDPSAVNTPTLPVARFAASRNFEGSACDNFGKGAGYGAVLTDPNDAANPLQNVRTFRNATLNGGFTVWVRREFIFNASPALASDNPAGESIVVTSEGSAPFAGDLGAFARANRSIRRLESHVLLNQGCPPDHSEDGTFRGCNS